AGSAIGESLRLLHTRGDAIDFRDLSRDVIKLPMPVAIFGVMVACFPSFHCSQHAHNFFFTDLKRSAEGVVGSAIGPSCLKKFLITEEKACSLRSSDAFATTVGYSGGSTLQMDIGNRQPFCCSINDDGHIVSVRHIAHDLCTERAFIARSGKDVNHRRSVVK